VDRAGRETDRSREADRTWRLIRDQEAIILDYRPMTGVTVLYDQDASLLDFAMEGNDERVTESHRGYYDAVWESDVWASYVRPVDLDELSPGLLIVPWHLLGKQDTLAKLRSFLEDGGTLLLEARFGLFDDGLFQHAHVPPADFVELFGYEEEEPYYQHHDARAELIHERAEDRGRSDAEALYDGPEIVVNAPVEGHFRAATYLVPLRVLDAEPIAWCHGFPVGVRKQVGKGTVYYFGTNLGAAIARGSTTAREIVRSLISSSTRPEVMGHHLRPRLITSDRGALLTVFNDDAVARSDDLRLAGGSWLKARDLNSGVILPIDGNILRVEVPAQDVRVFDLRHQDTEASGGVP